MLKTCTPVRTGDSAAAGERYRWWSVVEWENWMISSRAISITSHFTMPQVNLPDIDGEDESPLLLTYLHGECHGP